LQIFLCGADHQVGIVSSAALKPVGESINHGPVGARKEP